jgi:solute carrier family 35 protein
MTMILERVLLNSIPTRGIVVTVLVMIFGALVAAFDDLAFDVMAYIFILLNDAFTAAYGVFTKKRLNCKELGKYGLLYYNCLFR